MIVAATPERGLGRDTTAEILEIDKGTTRALEVEVAHEMRRVRDTAPLHLGVIARPHLVGIEIDHVHALVRLLVDIVPAPDLLITINADESILALRPLLAVPRPLTAGLNVDVPLLLHLLNLLDAQPAPLVHSHSKVHLCPFHHPCPALHHLSLVANSNHSRDLLFLIYPVS
jgi:hypothetical protein